MTSLLICAAAVCPVASAAHQFQSLSANLPVSSEIFRQDRAQRTSLISAVVLSHRTAASFLNRTNDFASSPACSKECFYPRLSHLLDVLEKEGRNSVQKRVIFVGDFDLVWGDAAWHRFRAAGYAMLPEHSGKYSFEHGYRVLQRCDGDRPALAVIGELETDSKKIPEFIDLAHRLDADHGRDRLPFLLLTTAYKRYGAYYYFDRVKCGMQQDALEPSTFQKLIELAMSKANPASRV